MNFHIIPAALCCAWAFCAVPASAQFATLPPADTPMHFTPAHCSALTEIRNGVATRSADEIEQIGNAMEANKYQDPETVARLSGLSRATVSTLGGLNQADGMAFSLVFGSMLRHYHPDLLARVLRDRGARGQIPDISGNPLGMTVLNGMMDTAQQSYLNQCS